MKILKLYPFGFLFILLSVSAYSQDTKSLYKEGNHLFKLEHYRKALPFLEKVVEAEPNNADALFKTGVCYLHRYSKEKALSYITKAYSIDSTVSKHIHYWLGRAYHQNYQYDKAISEYNIYKNSLKKSDERRKDLEKHIAQTNVARQLTENPENFMVRNLGKEINTIYSEHSPVTSANDSVLYFTSRRHDNTGGKEDLDGEFFEDIFFSKKLPNGEWSTPEKIHLNTSGHDASIQLLENDNKLLLYREAKGGDIYISERVPGTDNWKDPVKFANINTGDFEADAFITPDGKTVYFATNHYKKIGDLDIYYITKNDDGTWSRPKELEGKINTSEDEDAPFVTPDGKTLYFSSRGHKGMGGYDIFKSTRDENGNWSEPVNLGHPINTPDDDVYYYMAASGKRGFLSSYREGGFGEKDIYEIAPIPPVIIVAKLNSCPDSKREELFYSLKSLNKNTKKVSETGKLSGGETSINAYAYNIYRLAVYSAKDTLYTETFEVPFKDDPFTVEKLINIKCPGKDTQAAVVDTKPVTIGHKYVFRNIYFNKGKSELSPEAEREIEIAAEILKKNPTADVKILGAYSGDEGKEVGMNRAKAVRKKLNDLGVANTITDTTVKASGMDGKSAMLEVKLKKPLGMDFNESIIARSSVGTSYVLRNVYFETGKSDLDAQAKAELDILAEIMKENASLAIEIGGHTDSKGSDESNQKLSERRAQSVLNYLISKGIKSDRLTSKGYGESQPIADNETEKGRRLNRRTEAKIMRK
jgi:outer membrane protein OmpA-like peptidoglycan-associated protein